MDKDKMINIRQLIIEKSNGKAYQLIKEYGIYNFPVDYLRYLLRIGFSENLCIAELDEIFYILKYHYNKES